MTPAQARYAARGMSARLPTLYEAMRLLDLTRAGELGLEPLPAGLNGEFCDSVENGGGRLQLGHPADPAADPRFVFAPPKAAAPDRRYAFRLVTSHEPVR
jgi:hypothetical protein